MKEYPVRTADLSNGETIAYREAGDSSCVLVLLHGNMSSSVHWQTTMAALEDTHRVIAPDLRGFGDSSYRAPFDTLRELAMDVAELLDQLGIEKCTLLGWSAGGGVAMELAAERPELVKKLLLLSSVPTTGYPIYRKDAAGQPILTELLQTKEDVAQDPVQVLPMLAALSGGQREVMRAVWNATIYTQRTPPEEEYEAYLTATLQQRCLVDLDYALMCFNVTHRDNGVRPGSGRIDAIVCPVAILQGDKDLVVPPAWAERTRADFGERTEYITFVQAGHSVMTDDFDLFVSTLRGLTRRG